MKWISVNDKSKKPKTVTPYLVYCHMPGKDIAIWHAEDNSWRRLDNYDYFFRTDEISHYMNLLEIEEPTNE